MKRQLTKRSKASYYKHRLDKAIEILKEVKEASANLEYMGIEQIFEFEESVNNINFKIDNLLEDIDDEN